MYECFDPYAGPYYCTIENNICSTKIVTSVNDPHYELAAVSFEDWTALDPTFVYRNNKLVSGGNFVYKYGQYDGPASYIIIDADTISQLVSPLTNVYTFNVGDYRGSTGDIAKDIYYGTGTAPTSVTHQWRNSPTASGEQTIAMQRTLNINAKSELNGRPVSGATVNVYNGSDVLVASGTTDAIGAYNPTVTYQLYARVAADINYNNFRFNVIKSPTDNTNKLFTVGWNAYKDTVMMPNTLGDGMWPGAADIVEYRTTLEDRNRQRNLPGPKSQVVALVLAPQTVSFLQFNTDVSLGDTMPQFIRVADGAQTERYHVFSAAQEPNAYFEAEFSLGNGDTIIYAANRSAVYQTVAHINRIRANGSLLFIDSQNVSNGMAGIYRPMGMPAYRGNRSIVIPFRASSAGGSADDIRMLTSADNGTTWGAMTPGFTWSTASDKRVDGDEYIDGSIWFNGITAYMNPATSTGEFRTAVYNGTSWTMDNVYPARGYYSREYSSVIQADGMQHLLFSDTMATGQNSRITHLYKTFGSGAWQSKTLYTATVHTGQSAGSQPLPVGLTYTALNDVVRAFYCKQDSILYSREWLDTGWSTAELVVSTGRLLNALTTCNTVPSIHGDRAYVQYLERYTTGTRTVLATILGDGTSGGGQADPTGACCLASGACVTATSAECVSSGGTYQGDGIVCGDVSCAAPPVITATKAITGSVTITGNVRIE